MAYSRITFLVSPEEKDWFEELVENQGKNWIGLVPNAARYVRRTNKFQASPK